MFPNSWYNSLNLPEPGAGTKLDVGRKKDSNKFVRTHETERLALSSKFFMSFLI